MVKFQDKWNTEKCTTDIQSTGDSSQARVKCDCSVPGFIAVGVFVGNTLIQTKEIFHSIGNITFRLV